MKRDGDPTGTEGGHEGGVGRVEDECGVGSAGPRYRVCDGQCTVAEGFRRLETQCREVRELHAQVFGTGRCIGSPAVDGDLVALLDHPPTDLLDGCLEAAVGSGDASGADHGDTERTPHDQVVRHAQYAPCGLTTVLRVRQMIMKSPVRDQFST